MYNVLIVDDEPIARQSLKCLIDWNKLGFDIKGEAEDGQQALEILQKTYFALILTDIRMHTMNGLDFIAKLREFSDAVVIILSGYDDFEYACQGLKLGVHDYLLKPVDEEDLIHVLNKTRQKISQKNMTNKQMHLGLSVLRDQFLKKWVHGYIAQRDYIEQLEILNMHTRFTELCCIIVEMDFFHISYPQLLDNEVELKRFVVRNIIEEVCGEAGYIFEESDESYGVLLFGSENALSETNIYQLVETMASSIRKYTKETISIGLGHIVTNMHDVPLSFLSAEKALAGKFLRGNNSIINNEIMDNLEDAKLQELRILVSEVIEAIKSLHREHVAKAISRLWEQFKVNQVHTNIIKLSVLEIFIQLFQLMKELGANHSNLFRYELGDYEYVMKTKTTDELFKFTEKKCLDVLDLVHQFKDLQPNKAIEMVKKSNYSPVLYRKPK